MTCSSSTTRVSRIAVAVLVLLIAVSVGACSMEGASRDGVTTTSPISFPYPPFVIDTDVAIPLNQPLLDAAKFALDMSIDYRLKNDPREGAVARRFRSKIAPETNNGDLQSTPDIVVGYTGGALHRVVGARQLPDGNIEVSICMYDTPGLYTKFKDGRVVV